MNNENSQTDRNNERDMTDSEYVASHIQSFDKPEATAKDVEGLEPTPSELIAESYQQEEIAKRVYSET